MTDHAPRPGYGALFRDNAKRKPTAPDYKGQLCLPDGSRVNFAGWVTEGATGKYLSLKVSGDVLPPLKDGEPYVTPPNERP